MNLYDAVLRSLPKTTFKLNAGGTSFTDLTNRGVTLSGTQLLANQIVSGNAKSLNIKNSNVLNFATTVFQRGMERSPFTLEAWFLPLFFTSNISILSHDTAYDGIYFDGDKVHFKVEFETTGSVDLSFALPDFPDATHIVAIWNVSSVLLYCDGVLVAQADVTDAQIKDGFKTRASSNLYIGQSANASQAGMVDGIAVYHRALTDAEIYQHRQMGRRVMPMLDIAAAYGAINFDGADSDREVYFVKEWDDNWIDGILTNVETLGGSISPIEDPATQTSMAGNWIGTYEAGGNIASLYGVKVEWDGDGAYTVDASIDEGATWVAVTNKRLIPGTYAWNATDKNILIRVSFTGGIVSDTSYISRLRVTSYTSFNLKASDASRIITMSAGNSNAADRNEPIENNAGAGLELYSGSATIKADVTEVPRNVSAIEFWVKFNGPVTSNYVFDARSSGNTGYLWQSGTNVLGWANASAVYLNGSSIAVNSTGLNSYQWYHIIFVFSTPMNTDIVLSASGLKNFAVINLYPTAPTAAEAAAIYKAYGGYPEMPLGTDDLNISEASTPFKFYGYDWSLASN